MSKTIRRGNKEYEYFEPAHGYFRLEIYKQAGNAILRGEKTAITVKADLQIQKGDLITFICLREEDGRKDMFSDFDDCVFEVTHTFSGDGVAVGYAVVCIKRKPNMIFVEGDINSNVQEDTIFVTQGEV